MTEIWKDIKEYEGLYQVSNLGRVKRLERYSRSGNCYGLHFYPELIVKPNKLHKERRGYEMVCLYKDGQKKYFQVHRLVALHFIERPEHLKNIPFEELQVNHKDAVKDNNYAENLEWCTAKENCNEKHHIKALSKTVYQYSIDGQFIREWPSSMEIQRQLGYSNVSIHCACTGKCKTAYGFKWSRNKL